MSGVSEQTVPQFIVQIVTFVDECQRIVQEKRFLKGDKPAGFCAFVGAGVALLPNQDNVDQPIRHKGQFDIPGATTYQEAFGLFDTFWDQRLKQIGAISGIPKPKSVPFIVRIDQLLDSGNQSIQQHVLISGVMPDKYPCFRGTTLLQLPNGQEIPQEFILDGADTVDEAYALYGPVCAETVRRCTIQFEQMIARIDKETADRQAVEQARAQHENSAPRIIRSREDKRGKNGILGAHKSKLILPT